MIGEACVPPGRDDVILPLAPDMCGAVADMWVALFAAHDEGTDGRTLIRSAPRLRAQIDEWVAALLRDADQVGLVACRGDAPVGFAAATLHIHPWLEPERHGSIDALWVASDARRAGLGRRLADAAAGRLRERGATEIEAQVLGPPDRPAAAFWSALGYTTAATILRRR